MHMTRRVFNRMSAMAGLSFFGTNRVKAATERVPVAIVKSTDRRAGFSRAAALLGNIDFAEKDVYLKGNYNSPDPYPATTHPEALRAASDLLKAKGCRKITLVERSGMGETRQIWDNLKTLDQVRESGISALPLDELAPGDWRIRDLPGSHWSRGIEIPGFLTQESCVVQICNLKTHRFGGQFSASLKNSIGLIAKYSSADSHNYMNELHASRYQCSMIAEVNQVYFPALVIMDAVQVFIKGGPESGEVACPEIIAASRDRIAIDCVGLAILRLFGAESLSKPEALFAHEQLRRAAELGLGIHSEAEIELVAEDKAGRSMADQLEGLIKEK